MSSVEVMLALAILAFMLVLGMLMLADIDQCCREADQFGAGVSDAPPESAATAGSTGADSPYDWAQNALTDGWEHANDPDWRFDGWMSEWIPRDA